MNRTASEVAKILEVDAQQVKQWASEFRDYLSPAANPPKGSVRRFSDGDFLVLSYVWSYWEDDPDIECIKIGLNQGSHHEDSFLELLYIHTPLIQEPPEGLDEMWRHGILLYGGRHEYLELARNYRHVAESTLKNALEKGDMREWAYPVLFAYRHAMELYLKLIGEIDEPTHSLKRCVVLVEKRHQEKLPPHLRGWILELDQIDPAGTAFRYTEDDHVMNKLFEQWFDFRHFRFAMNRVFDALDMAILRAKPEGKPAVKKRKSSSDESDGV